MPQEMLNPKKLSQGDRVAAVCLSWGGAGTFPQIYEYGCQQLKDNFALEVVPMQAAPILVVPTGHSQNEFTTSQPCEKIRLGGGYREKGCGRAAFLVGCIEVLNMANGTSLWPQTSDFWNDRILFLEYSGELAIPEFTLWFLRNLAAQGALSKISGLLFGRNSHKVSPEFLKVFESEILRIIALEVRRPELPIVVDMDFGHVMPMMTLPLGRLAEIDCYQEKIHILESAVVD